MKTKALVKRAIMEAEKRRSKIDMEIRDLHILATTLGRKRRRNGLRIVNDKKPKRNAK